MSRVQLALVDYYALEVIPNLRCFHTVSTFSLVFLTSRRVRKHVELQGELELCLEFSTTHLGMLEFLENPVSDEAWFS